MLLSKLVYLCVKNVIYLGDTSFNYQDFVRGDFDSDVDYSTNINNVFSPLNEAISRLSDLERIPYRNEEINLSYKEVEDPETHEMKKVPIIIKEFDLDNLDHKVKEIVGIYQMFGWRAVPVDYKFVDLHKILILGAVDYRLPFRIEYKEDIKTFSREDIVPVVELEGEVIDENIDLYKEYGITETICNYIIEYVQGKLLEPIAPEMANLHTSRAESYFSNIPTVKKSSAQETVKTMFKVGM